MVGWIRDKRKEAGLSQGEVAAALGVSRPTYAKIEKGDAPLTASRRAALARVLGKTEANIAKRAEGPLARSAGGAVDAREIPKENARKFAQVLLYVLGKVGGRPNIGQTALYKLLYFIDFDYYEKYEEPLTGAAYMKNTYGPTPMSFAKLIRTLEREGKVVAVKSKYFDYDQTKYLAAEEADVSELSGRELKHIDDELDRLAHLSARQLSELSHLDTPWRVAKDKETLDYQLVFYRPEETSVREYETV